MSMNDDYIILRDEDGKAYIAHADAAASTQGTSKYTNWGRGAMRAGHKYLARWIENGKYMYAYTQQQLQAHLHGVKNKAQNTIEEATGVAARKRMDAAAAKYPEIERRRQAQDQAVQNKQNKTKEAGNKYLNSVGSRVSAEVKAKNSNAFTRGSNQAALETAKAQYQQAYKKAQADEQKQRKLKERTDDDWARGKHEYEYNKAAYDKSLAGAVDRTAARARETAANAKDAASSAFNRAKDSANNTVTNAKNTYERMRNEFKDRAREATGVSDRERMNNGTKTIAKDASENVAAKAKGEVGQAMKTVQSMIDNARSATSKAVKDAWDNIPKNADGTVNPFDKNFQSTYNDWKAKKDKYDSSLTGKAKATAEKATDSVKDMIDQAKRTARDAAASAQSTIDNATGNNYRKRAQEANQAAENAINQRSRTNDQLENQRSKYGSKENDQDHIYGDSEGYYYNTKEQRDRAEALISKRDQYDADIVNNNRASKFNDSMYADSKAGRINSLLGRETSSTSERSNSKATEVNNKWDRQEAESKLIGGRLDPSINVSKEYVYSRASNSGMASEVSKVMKLEEAMRSAERAYERLGEDSSKPQSSSRAARNKMLDAQKAYNEAYEELIGDINKQYDRDLAAYEKQYGKYNR